MHRQLPDRIQCLFEMGDALVQRCTYLIRFADDLVMVFEERADAERVHAGQT